MFLRAILMILMLVGLAGAPAASQSIFIPYKGKDGAKAEEKTDDGEKKPFLPNIFNKLPDNLASSVYKPKSKLKFTDYKLPDIIPLKDKDLSALTKAKMDLYEKWINENKTPKTTEEMVAFSQAGRAYSGALMAKRHEMLLEIAQKRKAAREKNRQILEQEKQQRLQEVSVKEEPKGEAPIYVKPKLLKAPSKLFNPY